MAYDQTLAQRIHDLLSDTPGLQEKRMFGGIGYLVHGNMACGVHGNNLIVRVGPERYQQALKQPYTGQFDMTGKPMSGWIVVAPQGAMTEADLKGWIFQGVNFALTLPAK